MREKNPLNMQTITKQMCAKKNTNWLIEAY